MNSPMQVAVTGSVSEAFVVGQQAIWASLPMSLTPAKDAARLVAVDGRSSGWLDAVADAVRSEVAGVLLVRPASAAAGDDVRELHSAATRAGVVVAVQSRWAAHPAVADLERTVADRLPDAVLVDSLAVVADTDDSTSADVLLDQLALLRAVSRPLESVRFAARSGYGYTVAGRADSTTFALAGVRSRSARPCARVAIYGGSAEAHLTVPADGTGAPAVASFIDADAKSIRPSWYESAARASWRRVHEAASARVALSDLTALADDLDLVVIGIADR